MEWNGICTTAANQLPAKNFGNPHNFLSTFLASFS